MREWIATYDQVEDLVNIGAYVKGSNPKIDQAVELHPRIIKYLRQDMMEKANFADTLAGLHGIIRAGEAFAGPQDSSESTEEPTPPKMGMNL